MVVSCCFNTKIYSHILDEFGGTYILGKRQRYGNTNKNAKVGLKMNRQSQYLHHSTMKSTFESVIVQWNWTGDKSTFNHAPKTHPHMARLWYLTKPCSDQCPNWLPQINPWINFDQSIYGSTVNANQTKSNPTISNLYLSLSLSTSPSGHPVQAYLLILLHSILFYILFYSALFCSILFSALLFYSFLLTWYPKINILRFFGGTIMINHALDFEAPYFRTKNRTWFTMIIPLFG